jgi:hypothetical protein
MEMFTVGGSPALQKAFAEEVGVEINRGYNVNYRYLCPDDFTSGFDQVMAKCLIHFDLPQDWHEAVSYVKRYFGKTNQVEFINPVVLEVSHYNYPRNHIVEITLQVGAVKKETDVIFDTEKYKKAVKEQWSKLIINT